MAAGGLGEAMKAGAAEGARALARLPGRLLADHDVRILLIACLVGVVAGAGVTAMSRAAHAMHALLFSAGPEGLLSAVAMLPDAFMYLIPAVGGLLIGLYSLAVKRFRPRPVVDPIEANALEGGRMSLLDSVLLSVQTTLCNGFGASVGMEAGYTQWGSGAASALGQKLGLLRSDMRVLVGCGAASGIAAAFHAPFTGAFYAFELIIGVYAIPSVAPVMAASLVGFLTARTLGALGTPIIVPEVPAVSVIDHVPFIALGLIGAALAIGIMRLVTLVEQMFSRSRLPAPLRPMVGGLVVGVLALASPQILASGEGAMHIELGTGFTAMVAGVLVLKILAAAFSLGSGFRGGLFSAALFMGAMMGKVFAAGMALLLPVFHVDPVVAAVVGMAALAVGIVGGPFTMTFLTLESTGDMAISGLVLTSAIVCSLTVRGVFGYSFTTWRMHLRGETIRSAHDVGMLRGLTVGRVMEPVPLLFPAAGTIEDLRASFAASGAETAILTGDDGRYMGLASRASASGPMVDPQERAGELAQASDITLSAGQRVKEASRAFSPMGISVLAVVDDDTGRPVGLLTEAAALRAYVDVLERIRRSLSGSADD